MASTSDRGFVLFHRKFWDNPILKEPGKPFSKREAWLYLFSNLANGIDRNGVPRGEFIASIRFLSKAWRWPKSNVSRFIELLEKESMIKQVSCNPISVGQQMGQQAGHFIICNYESYQKAWTTKRDTKWDKSKESIKESIKENTTNAKTVLTMILKTGEEFPITEEHIDLFNKTYPTVDILEKLQRMKTWCITHPDKRKTKRGILAFIDNWLSRDQEVTKAQNLLSGITSNFGA